MRRRRKKYRTGRYTSTKTDRTHVYRSSYELRMMQCLDCDDDVVDWNHESIMIEHRKNIVLTDEQVIVDRQAGKKNRSYTPDFIVTYADGRRHMIETKSGGNVRSMPTLRKHALGEQYCSMHGMVYMLWTLDDIIMYEMSLGIRMHDHDAWQETQHECEYDDG